MSTLSVSLSDKYLEEQAIKEVLDARKEPSLSGDLDELATKF